MHRSVYPKLQLVFFLFYSYITGTIYFIALVLHLQEELSRYNDNCLDIFKEAYQVLEQ